MFFKFIVEYFFEITNLILVYFAEVIICTQEINMSQFQMMKTNYDNHDQITCVV